MASKIVRPSTIYQVIVSLLQEAEPMRVRAALSRDGVEVYGNSVNMQPLETRPILLQVSFKYQISKDQFECKLFLRFPQATTLTVNID